MNIKNKLIGLYKKYVSGYTLDDLKEGYVLVGTNETLDSTEVWYVYEKLGEQYSVNVTNKYTRGCMTSPSYVSKCDIPNIKWKLVAVPNEDDWVKGAEWKNKTPLAAVPSPNTMTVIEYPTELAAAVDSAIMSVIDSTCVMPFKQVPGVVDVDVFVANGKGTIQIIHDDKAANTISLAKRRVEVITNSYGGNK